MSADDWIDTPTRIVPVQSPRENRDKKDERKKPLLSTSKKPVSKPENKNMKNMANESTASDTPHIPRAGGRERDDNDVLGITAHIDRKVDELGTMMKESKVQEHQHRLEFLAAETTHFAKVAGITVAALVTTKLAFVAVDHVFDTGVSEVIAPA